MMERREVLRGMWRGGVGRVCGAAMPLSGDDVRAVVGRASYAFSAYSLLPSSELLWRSQ